MCGKCLKSVLQVSGRGQERAERYLEGCLVKSGKIKSGQVKLGQVKSGQAKLGQVKSGQVQSGQVKLGQESWDRKVGTGK